MGQREMTLDDYVALLRRRKWPIILLSVLGPAIALGISLPFPSRYTSQSLILIEQQRVPDSFVPPVITRDLNARIANIQEQIFSRTRLQPIIERYGLFKDEAGREPMEKLIERLRQNTELTPIKPIVRSREEILPGFYIAVTLADPRLAQQVCAEIASMFIEEDLRRRDQTARGTTSFLDAQLQDAKRALDEQEKRLAEFKGKYIGTLPDETQTNLNILATLNTELQAVTQALNRAQQDRTYVESLLAQQFAAWQALKTVKGPHPETVDEELAGMENELLSLQTKYTSDYPDVIRLKAAIAELKKVAHAPNTTAKSDPPDKVQAPPVAEPPAMQQLRSQLRAYDEAIKANTQEQKHFQEQIKAYQSRIQMSPLVEQQYKEITRDHETALDFYNELLKKKNQSAMATDLEHRQEGEQLRVMDPANLPEKPSFPNRPLFGGVGFAVGLALGLGIAMLLEMRDKTLRTERDIEFYLRLPILARVPSIHDPEAKGHSRRGHSKKLTPAPEHAVGA